MENGIAEFRLGDRCLVKSSKRVFAKEYVKIGIPFFRSKDVIDKALGVFEHYDLFIAEKRYLELKETHGSPARGDVLLSSVGNRSGQSYVVRDEGDFYFKDGNILWLSQFKDLDPYCLSYWLKSTAGQHALASVMIGSAQKALTIDAVKKLSVTLPEVSKQRSIAAVLTALGDKIQLNRRMNGMLEAMLRTLFQNWFVDFDLIRAKLDGRQPGTLDPATAALFPNEFEDSELGLIPKGWSVTTVGAKLSPVLGGTPSRARPEYWTNGTIAWINSGKINEFRIVEPSEWITEEALRKSATKLLPRRTTVLAITGATLGQVSVTEIECCANQSVVAVPASDEFPTEFIYPWIEENIQELLASQTGGAQQHVNKGNVEALNLLCPNRPVMEAYLRIAKPLFDKIATNCFQSRTLAALRDTLLPPLLRGTISLPTTGIAS
jgi:type I restriction enzyme S subunit